MTFSKFIYLKVAFHAIESVYLIYVPKRAKSLRTFHTTQHIWPLDLHLSWNRTYSFSLLYIPRATFIYSSVFSRNLRPAVLSKSLVRWWAICIQNHQMYKETIYIRFVSITLMHTSVKVDDSLHFAWLLHTRFLWEKLGQNDKSVNGVNYSPVSCQKRLKNKKNLRSLEIVIIYG